jgi:hypothetical protein
MSSIFELLKSLNITFVFVYRTVKSSNRLYMVLTAQVINTFKSRINRNPVQIEKILAWEMHITLRNMSRVTKQDLGPEAFKRKTGQCLAVALKENWGKKSRCL